MTMTRETDNKDDDDDEETWGEVKNLSTLSSENWAVLLISQYLLREVQYFPTLYECCWRNKNQIMYYLKMLKEMSYNSMKSKQLPIDWVIPPAFTFIPGSQSLSSYLLPLWGIGCEDIWAAPSATNCETISYFHNQQFSRRMGWLAQFCNVKYPTWRTRDGPLSAISPSTNPARLNLPRAIPLPA